MKRALPVLPCGHEVLAYMSVFRVVKLGEIFVVLQLHEARFSTAG
ncbi:hypothetical protein [Noviherbaspirillum aerium]|nr:hypothetical protein [Noviherbaspirillum aerium]